MRAELNAIFPPRGSSKRKLPPRGLAKERLIKITLYDHGRQSFDLNKIILEFVLASKHCHLRLAN